MNGATELRARIAAVEQAARQRGTLLPLAVERREVPDGRLPYVAAWLSSIGPKDRAGRTAPARDPFLPFEPDMYVADAGPRHVLLVCKFQTEPGHVLVVSREDRPQHALLEDDDLAATCLVHGELGGVVMYNAGRAAGASQSHRHLHVLPTLSLPLDEALGRALPPGATGRFAAFRFAHCLARLEGGEARDATALGQRLRVATAQLRLDRATPDCAPYNLLLTRRWLLVVPRSDNAYRAGAEALSLNALAFGGHVSVGTQAQQQLAVRAGLATLLEACAVVED